MSSTLPPRQPGYFLFLGNRHVRNAMYERICEPVQIVEWKRGNVSELAVVMLGRSDRFPLARFDGTWIEIDTEAA